MTARESITVSAEGFDSNDPTTYTINAELPDRDTRPVFVLSSWAPPDFAMRLTYAADQPDVPGKVLLSAALDAGTLPLGINVHGVDMADMQANRRTLEAIFSQFAYTITLNMAGQAEAYSAAATWPTWEIDLSQLIATATLTVPVNPPGA